MIPDFYRLYQILANSYKPSQISKIALPSLIAQTHTNFEWVVINDRSNPDTRKIIEELSCPFELVYKEIPHATQGFGLCHARNQGLKLASGELITYLDDDNYLEPEFVASSIKFYQQHPCTYTVTTQRRRRDIVKNQQKVTKGASFISPDKNATIEDFICQKYYIDSNGFIHPRHNAPQWNPDYRIYADYEYFLQCIDRWETEQFCINPVPLVNYIQTSLGIIGQSTYSEWVSELIQLKNSLNQYPIINQTKYIEKLGLLISYYQKYLDKRIKAFAS
ncbi:MAG: glycosyltransferase family A protein [Cyanobacteriota bacterium]|nr:glycosyltransferase family A protein [Cyanobacteriota bacterium]